MERKNEIGAEPVVKVVPYRPFDNPLHNYLDWQARVITGQIEGLSELVEDPVEGVIEIVKVPEIADPSAKKGRKRLEDDAGDANC